MKRAASSVAVILLAAISVSCSFIGTSTKGDLSGGPCDTHAEECFKRAVTLKEDAKPGEAMDAFLGIRERFEGTEWALRASLNLAVLSIGEGGGMARFYLREAFALKELDDYLLMSLARAYAAEEMFDEAAAAYDYVIERYPDSALIPEALYERALAFDGAGLTADSIVLIGEFIDAYQEHRLIPRALLSKAGLHMKAGDKAGAFSAIRRIMSSYPLNREAAEAEDMLSKTLPGIKADLFLSLNERFLRGEVFFRAGRYNEAAKEFSYVSRGADGELSNRALMQLAVSRLRLKKYDGAKKALMSYLYRKSPEKKEKEALLWLSTIALREDDIYELENVDERLGKRHPESPERARSLIHIGRYHEWKKDFPNALEAYRAVVDGFEGEAAAEACWRAGWIYYKEARFDEAQKTFEGCLGQDTGSWRWRDQFLYWGGRSLEKTGRLKDASLYYGRLCSEFGSSYYCKMYRGRLANAAAVNDAAGGQGEAPAYNPGSMENTGGASGNGLKAGLAPPENGLAPKGALNGETEGGVGVNGSGGYVTGDDNNGATVKRPESGAVNSITLDRRYVKALSLVKAGLKSYARAEFDILLKDYRRDTSSLVELGKLLYEGGDYRRALTVYWRYISAAGVGESQAAPEIQRASFPPDLVDKIRRISPEGSADPCLVAAVMREESGYNPEVVSWAGALGLMQIIPETGNLAARELGMGTIQREDLFDPETNIKIGAWYLGRLLRRFGGDMVLTIASYNAGPLAAQRWAETGPGEMDEFIESIPYDETRYYVKRVLRSYSEFLRLAGVDGLGGAGEMGVFTRPSGASPRLRSNGPPEKAALNNAPPLPR